MTLTFDLLTLTFSVSTVVSPVSCRLMIDSGEARCVVAINRRRRVHDGKAPVSRDAAVPQSDWWIRVRGAVCAWLHTP